MTSIPPGNKLEEQIGITLYRELNVAIDAAGGGRTACRMWPEQFTSPKLEEPGTEMAADLVEACSFCPIVDRCREIADALPESQRGCMVLGGKQFNLAGSLVTTVRSAQWQTGEEQAA